MKKEEIKEIVRETIEELTAQGRLVDDDMSYRYMSKKLFEYFKTGMKDENITKSLQEIDSDRWSVIIGLYYRDCLNVNEVAECMYCDVSTIVRNKKRLVMTIFNKCTPE